MCYDTWDCSRLNWFYKSSIMSMRCSWLLMQMLFMMAAIFIRIIRLSFPCYYDPRLSAVRPNSYLKHAYSQSECSTTPSGVISLDRPPAFLCSSCTSGKSRLLFLAKRGQCVLFWRAVSGIMRLWGDGVGVDRGNCVNGWRRGTFVRCRTCFCLCLVWSRSGVGGGVRCWVLGNWWYLGRAGIMHPFVIILIIKIKNCQYYR